MVRIAEMAKAAHQDFLAVLKRIAQVAIRPLPSALDGATNPRVLDMESVKGRIMAPKISIP